MNVQVEQVIEVPKVQVVEEIVEVPVVKKMQRVVEVPQVQKVQKFVDVHITALLVTSLGMSWSSHAWSRLRVWWMATSTF